MTDLITAAFHLFKNPKRRAEQEVERRWQYALRNAHASAWQTAPSQDSILLGCDDQHKFYMPWNVAMQHGLYLGATRGGKTTSMRRLIWLMLIARRGNLVYTDPKGPDSQSMAELDIPYVVSQLKLTDKGLDDFFQNYYFLCQDGPYVTPTNWFADQTVSIRIRTRQFIAALGSGIEAAGQTGVRMDGVFSSYLPPILSVHGTSPIELQAALGSEKYFHNFLRFAPGDVAQQALLTKHPASAVSSCANQVRRLIADPSVERMLCGSTSCVQPRRLIEGTTIASLAYARFGPPTFLLRMLSDGLKSAILSRKVSPSTEPTLYVIDEAPVVLASGGKSTVLAMEQLIALSAAKKVSLIFVMQGASQIKSPAMFTTLLNNVSNITTFRQEKAGASKLAHLLPPTVRVAHDGVQPTLQKGDAAKVMSVVELPDRHCFVTSPRFGLGTVKLRAPDIDFDHMRREVDTLSPDIRDACLGATHSISQDKLDRVIEMRRAHIRKVAAGHALSPLPNFDERAIELSSTTKRSDDVEQPTQADKIFSDHDDQAGPFLG